MVEDLLYVLSYTSFMLFSPHSIFSQLQTSFSQVQHSARTLKDIEFGISRCVHLLRAASQMLKGATVTHLDLDKPRIPLFMMRGPVEITYSFVEEPFLNLGDLRHQVHTNVVYGPEEELDFELVFNSLPDIGIAFENVTTPSNLSDMAVARLFFSPAKWPIMAGHLISNVCQNEGNAEESLSSFFSVFYPGVPLAMMLEFARSGITASPSELCDLLLDNQEARPVYTGDLIVPTDL